jgi:predicted O-linked N-acetylglucosamine transferase (SPINDLY family)
VSAIAEALARAVAHHRVGQLPQAEQIYRQVLQADPRNADAWHLLGVIASQVNNHSAAVEHIRRAIELNPKAAAFHANLGAAYQKLDRMDEAVACYRRALELNPDNAEAHNNLGVASQRQGDLAAAEGCFRRALKCNPGYADAQTNLENVLKGQGKLEDLLASRQRTIELKPHDAVAHNDLGAAFQDLAKIDDAIACYRRAVQLRPDYAEAHYNLGNALKEQGKLDEAIACCRRALALKPDFAQAHNVLGNALKDQGLLDEAVACYHRALECDPNYAGAHNNLLLALQYCDGVTLSALAEAHADYDRRHAAHLLSQHLPKVEQVANGPSSTGRADACPTVARIPQRSLRIGFVSPDFGRHPVGWFLRSVLENLGRHQFETVCYSDRIVKDDFTSRLQAAATQWRDVVRLNDQRLSEQIRGDRIDILFDLAGHTAGNRLLVFARKPAPIQITWAGYVGTTGLTAMDYLLADRYEVPPGAEQYYRERVLRMPDGYICYEPPAYAPAVTPLPAWESGGVTFGSFNNPAKITGRAIEVWATILRRMPGARLVLKFKGWDNTGLARRCIERFGAYGIGPDRLELLGPSPHDQFLAAYSRIDLALDTFPYCGGLTTCEALWMGVPVITCPGETFAGRHSLSHLSNVGLTETIAHDLDEYVELAVSLAGNLPRLAALRAGLRQQMAASPLCDGKRFSANLAAVLYGAWEQCTGQDS